MKKLAIYGKGGVGKSTVVSNLTMIFALDGKKTLQVGCDPKADSTILLCDSEKRVSVLDALRERRKISSIDEILMKGRHGVDCVESGGPAPGVGCGGRGVLRMLEIFDELKLLEAGNYDIALYDVLGDIVCGGFAAPLRLGFGELVFIVVSDEEMSMYAANNIARLVVEYSDNDIAFGGLIVNRCDDNTNRGLMEAFADKLSARIAGWIPADPLFKKAGRKRTTIAEMAPESMVVESLRGVAKTILSLQKEDLAIPIPMENDEMIRFIREWDDDD